MLVRSRKGYSIGFIVSKMKMKIFVSSEIRLSFFFIYQIAYTYSRSCLFMFLFIGYINWKQFLVLQKCNMGNHLLRSTKILNLKIFRKICKVLVCENLIFPPTSAKFDCVKIHPQKQPKVTKLKKT
jgi:hypothetical protein